MIRIILASAAAVFAAFALLIFLDVLLGWWPEWKPVETARPW